MLTRAAVDGKPSQIPAFFTFDLYLGVKVTQNVAQEYHLYHVTYAPANFEVATSTGLGDALFDLDPVTQMLLSTLRITWPICTYLQSLKLLCQTVWEDMHLQENT